MLNIRKFSLLISLIVVAAIVVPSMAVSAQPPQTITYASFDSDPEPKAFDEMIVELWTEANSAMPVEHSQSDHESFKQAARTYLTANPAPDVLNWLPGAKPHSIAIC